MMLLRLPWRCCASGMFAEARTNGFHAIMRKKAASLLQRLHGSNNSILKMIAARPDCPFQGHWNSAIHPAECSKSNGTKAAASGSHKREADRDYRVLPEHNPTESDPLWWRDKFALDESQLTLVGFSKGCVVLNQLIYEFHYVKTLTPGDAHMMRFMSRIVDMYWLDGGHAGGKNTWITSRSLLETLTRLNINIFVHVSPYQVQDETRPWIGREEKAFTGLLKKNGAKVNRYLHDQPGMPHSLNMHFEVLANFKSMQDCIPSGMPDTSDEET